MVLPLHDGFIEPLCGFYHRRILPVMESNMIIGKLSLLDLQGQVPHRLIEIMDLPSEEIALLFRNMNEKSDLL
jgi:molybdopterin-guanine dinucleotide biosynthesis protein A